MKLRRLALRARPALPWLLGALLVAGAAMPGYSLWCAREALIVLSPKRGHQTITGWEVTARAWEFDKRADRYDGSWLQYRDALIDRLVNELGINQVRLELASGAENPVDYWSSFVRHELSYQEFKRHFYEKINDDADPEHVRPGGFQWSALDYRVENVVLPLRRALALRGEKLRLNLCYVDFRWTELKGTLQHATAPEEYAELIEAAVLHLRDKYGLEPDQLELILEPDNTDGWRGERIGRAAVAVTRRLRRRGRALELVAPSTASPHEAARYFDALIAIPGAREQLGTLSYHRYSPLPTALALPELVARARAHGLRTAMLEHVDGDAAQLHEDLTRGDVTSWQMYGMAMTMPPAARDSGGAYLLADPAAAEPCCVLSDRARALAQTFRNVRAGALRLEASSSVPERAATFFRNLDGRHVIVVRSEHAGVARLRGVPRGSYGVSVVSAAQSAPAERSRVVADGTDVVLQVPKSSVVALVQQAPRAD
ncbi:MAG: hypothetical protein JWN48_1368 [Myxococcaceae bacterium]|nr:hypothetical protein [Myxococcaceae bacterium]